MHARRLACLFLGIWLGGSLLMAWLSSQNRKLVDGVLADDSPAARIELKTLGPNARSILLYQAAEQNRRYLQDWTLAEIAIGAIFFFVMLFGSRENAWVLIGLLFMLLLTAVQRFFIVPEEISLGRILDFLPADQPTPERNRLWVLEIAYYGLEAVKWIAGLVLAGGMVFSRRRSGRSRDSRREFDVVNKSDYGRINR